MWRSPIFRRVVIPLIGLWALPWIAVTILLFTAAESWMIALGALVSLAITVGLALGLSRHLMAPLHQLCQGLHDLRDGKPIQRIAIDQGHAMAAVAAAFKEASEACALRESRLGEDSAQLRAILQSMLEGVLVIDSQQRIGFINEAAERFLHWQHASPVGAKVWEVARHRQLAEAVEQVLSSPQPRELELEWGLMDRRILAVHGVQLPGTPVRGAVFVFHDITDLRRLERVRHDFVANVSHELKTPLAAIQATVETLLDGAAGDPEYSIRFIERIRENSDRLYRLVQDLLTLGRIEAGRETLALETLSLHAAAETCVAHQSDRARDKGLSLEVESAADPVYALADDEALADILNNLVDNAIKYTHPGGKINLRAFAQGEKAILQVEDTGVGIPEKDLSRIFERFYRVDKARSRELGGTGLGLSIVKHLVQQLGGSISAESEVGRGTTFTVSLARAETPSHIICTESS